MASPTVSRYPDGLNDSTDIGAYANYAGMRPFRYHNWINDFDDFVNGDWVRTLATSATAAVAAAGDGGVLAITNVNAGAADESSIQWAGGSGAFASTFVWDPLKDMLIAASFQVDDVVNTALLIGLATVDTTPLSSLVANFIGLYKASGAAALVGGCNKGSTLTSVALGNMVNATYASCVMYYSASTGNWQVFLNNNLVGTISTASVTPTGNLAPTIAILNASAVAHAISVDWLMVAKQR